MDSKATVIFCIYIIIFVTSLNFGRAVSKDTFIWQLTGTAITKDTKGIVIAEKGILEVRKNQGNWMRVCAAWTDDKVKNVACRQRGFLGVINSNVEGTEQAGIILQNFSCPLGNERDITYCTFPTPSSDKCPIAFPNRSLAVEVNCTTNVGLLGLLNVDLMGGYVHSGALEYTHNGKKTPVCYDEPQAESVASIVCKQMGYSDKIKASAVASSATEFASLECSGSEQTLDACTFKNHVSSCTKGLVVAVECKLNMTTQNFFDIRLSSPDRSPSYGTVEVWKYGYWGVICDNDWTIEDANVVCRQLGYRKATDAPKNAMYGQGTGVVFWDKVNCTGNEFSIADCPHPTAVVSATCDSTKAAGVSCDTTNPLTSNYICSATDGQVSIPAGDSFLRFPDGFIYKNGATCSCTSTKLTAATTLTLYIHQKMFQKNHVESLTFYNDSSEIQLYGDDSSAGPFSFTNTNNFTIEFKSDNSAGEGMLNIQVKATKPVEFACTKTVKGPSTTPATTTTNTSTNGTASSFELRDNDSKDKTDMTVGIVISAIALITFIVVGIVLCIKYNARCSCRGSVTAFEKGIEGSKQEQKGGVDNHTFTEDNQDMKRNDSESADGLKGTGGTDVNTETGLNTDEPKEPETGERKQNGGIGVPASGSEVKVDIDSSATADNANNHTYAVVNKGKRGQKGPAFVTTNETPNPRAKPPPYVYANNLKQDIDNGNINDDSVQPVEYEEVGKPFTFVPGQNSAYADVEFGVGGASIQKLPKQETPVTKNKTKNDKKKKEDKKKSKKEGKKGAKTDDKKNVGSSAVPMMGDYAEVGQMTGAGQIEPAGGSQPDESENVYDVFNRKGPNYRPEASDSTYGVLQG